jgi:hypothetical protein
MSFHPDTLTRSYPPTSSHEPGKCTVPKAVERLCPGYEKFLPFSKRPRSGQKALGDQHGHIDIACPVGIGFSFVAGLFNP